MKVWNIVNLFNLFKYEPKRLICLAECDKTSEKRKRKSVVFGINVYLNKFNIKFY